MIGITLDIDWAPDFMIDEVAELLLDRGVKATWFVTHASPAVTRLSEHPEQFELGIHPNFAAGSSHGDTLEAVLEFCSALVPEAVSVRPHGLASSSRLLQAYAAHPVLQNDATLYMHHANELKTFIVPTPAGNVRRVPFVWEDDIEFCVEQPSWDPQAYLRSGSGIKVFNFHPVHVWLNTSSDGPYRTLINEGVPLPQVAREAAVAFRQGGNGARQMFERLLAALAEIGGGHTIRQIAAEGPRWS